MTDKHRCENMPNNVELHKDIVMETIYEKDYWVINIVKEDRSKSKDTIFGGTNIIYCGWCGIKLESLK